MKTEPLVAFATKTEPPALEIRVNFGIFAGRPATAAEIDELAKSLIPEVGEVSIVAEERHEISEEVEASLHQVRVEIAEEHLPHAGAELDDLTGRLVSRARSWAEACFADRHAEVSEL
ncbi:MAG: hypothetical protein ACRDN6_01945 [Gaiellaceae bacterium]